MTATEAFDGPRRIQRSELQAADRLAQLCFGEDPPTGEPDPGAGTAPGADTDQTQESGETYVITTGGRLVSQLCTFQERIHAFDGILRAGCIGGVCTHPDYRGRELATKLLEHCTRKLYAGGARLLVVSGDRGLYQRLGIVPAGSYAQYKLRPGQIAPPGRQVTLRPITPAYAIPDAMLCTKMYASEPVHFQRKMEIFRDHFRSGGPENSEVDWIVELDGKPQAFLLVNTDWQLVVDYGGSRVALAAGLAAAVTRPGLLPGFQALEADIPWQDVDLISLLNDMGCRPEWTTGQAGTLRVINFPGLFADLRTYIASRLGPILRKGVRFEQSGPLLGAAGGDRYAIVRGRGRGADRLELSGAELTLIVMGSPETPPPFPGALSEVIPALFPLPSFLPGLNFH